MRNVPHATRNVIALLIAQAVAAVVGIFAFTRISSAVPVAELGRFGFAASSTMIFGLLAELGMRYVAIKEIALDPSQSRKVFRHSVVLRLGLSIGALAVIILCSEIYPPWRQEGRLLFFAGLVAVSQFGAEPVGWVFFGRGRVDIGAIILIVDRILYVVAVNLTAGFFNTAEALLASVFAANLLRSFICLVWVHRTWECPVVDRTWDTTLFKRMILEGVAIGGAIIISVSYTQIGAVVAQSVVGPVELGYYMVAFGLISIFLIVPMALTNALFPSLAAAAAVSPAASRNLYSVMTRLTLVTIVPLAVIMFVFADSILNLWVGPLYADAAPILRVLSIGMVASSLNYLYRIFLFARNRPALETTVDLVALVLMIVFGSLAGSRFGSTGIATVYTALEILLFCIKFTIISFLERKDSAALVPLPPLSGRNSTEISI